MTPRAVILFVALAVGDILVGDNASAAPAIGQGGAGQAAPTAQPQHQPPDHPGEWLPAGAAEKANPAAPEGKPTAPPSPASSPGQGNPGSPAAPTTGGAPEPMQAPSLPSTHAPPAAASAGTPSSGTSPPAPPKLTIHAPTLPTVPSLNDACTEAAQELRKPISADVPTLRLVLDLILAEYPNDQGVFEARPVVKPTGGKPVPELDWLAALNELKLDTQPELEPARKEAIRITSALRQLAASRRYDKGCDAAKALLDFAFAGAGSVFRDEVGRQLRRMESASLPALIRVALSDSTSNKALKRYANYQLDRMDRQRPQTVLAQVHDDPLRAEILRAYGQSRP